MHTINHMHRQTARSCFRYLQVRFAGRIKHI